MELSTKQERIINQLLKLESSIIELKKLSASSFVDYFAKLIQNDKLNLFDELTTTDNLKLLGITKKDIDNVRSDKLATKKQNLKKAREAKKSNE